MVVDGANVIAATGRHHERRFNVAASRARDQMWLFHSMAADQLSSKDLRHSLLTSMQSPPAPYTHAHQPTNVSADQRCKPFDSLFAQRVFLHIKERGYDVVPQWEVNGKEIDLVVTGDYGRLAVECDGSPHHSTRQQIHDDAERERELRRTGWTFWRVRSSAFALSPEEALAPLWKRLTDLGIHPRTTPAAFSDDTEPHAAWTPAGLAEGEPDDEDLDPYVLASPVTRGVTRISSGTKEGWSAPFPLCAHFCRRQACLARPARMEDALVRQSQPRLRPPDRPHELVDGRHLKALLLEHPGIDALAPGAPGARMAEHPGRHPPRGAPRTPRRAVCQLGRS
ncbi:hypothetical protein [Streptomyces yangpuensis]|uniref:hypothetical protein n=1 Tax=Streptomyces yangpuensis TaxID=1648182 RepID=UPI003825BBD2